MFFQFSSIELLMSISKHKSIVQFSLVMQNLNTWLMLVEGFHRQRAKDVTQFLIIYKIINKIFLQR